MRIVAVLIGLVLVATVEGRPIQGECVQVYYDRAPGNATPYTYGRLHAHYLQNLLGHFPHYQQVVIPISQYQAGQLDRCKASFYLGTYYDNPIPQAFLDDFKQTRRNVFWGGYNVWQMGSRMADTFGVAYAGLSKLDTVNREPDGAPGFYKEYSYKGEVFTKYASFRPEKPNQLSAAWEITLLNVVDPGRAKVLSEAKHSTQGSSVPYLIQGKNQWYMGDSPFAYISLEDRYLIMADVIFDVLEEQPRFPGKRPALVRFEDMHPQLPMRQVDGIIQAAERAGINYGISLVPIFKDPYGVLTKDPAQQSLTLEDRPVFLKAIQEAVAGKGSVLFHGATHQFETMKNPVGVSGVDFEFWDINRNKPMLSDSPEFVLDRLEPAWELMEKVGIRPSAWLPPHYAASPLDSVMFGQLFLWSVGRAIYYPSKVTQSNPLPMLLTFDLFGSTANGHRLKYFKDLQVEHPDTTNPGGQYFPYEIHGDIYGQRIIPENVGFIRPGKFEVDDLLRILKRNRVIRDAWGSFFVHPFMVEARANGGLGDFPGDTREIERLFQGAMDLGYEFIDLKTFTYQNLVPKRRAPVEVEPGEPQVALPTLSGLLGLWLRQLWGLRV